jgi:hypothetical protein
MCLSFPGKGDHRTPSSGLAQPRHTRPASLFVPPAVEETALGAATEPASPSWCCRQNRAVIRAAVGDFLATLGVRPPVRASSRRKLVRHCRQASRRRSASTARASPREHGRPWPKACRPHGQPAVTPATSPGSRAAGLCGARPGRLNRSRSGHMTPPGHGQGRRRRHVGDDREAGHRRPRPWPPGDGLDNGAQDAADADRCADGTRERASRPSLLKFALGSGIGGAA